MHIDPANDKKVLYFFAGPKTLYVMINEFFSRNIFLAEDDEDDVILFEQALSEVYADAVLTMRENGKDLIDLLDVPPVPPPDVIFLDLNMPLKNGYECLKEIRAERSLNVPVVVLTTSSYDHDIETVYELGATRFIVKPRAFEDLKAIIKKVLSTNWSESLQPSKEHFVMTA